MVDQGRIHKKVIHSRPPVRRTSKHEAATAQGREHGFDHACRGHRRNRGIEGITTVAQYRLGCCSRLWVTGCDHVMSNCQVY